MKPVTKVMVIYKESAVAIPDTVIGQAITALLFGFYHETIVYRGKKNMKHSVRVKIDLTYKRRLIFAILTP